MKVSRHAAQRARHRAGLNPARLAAWWETGRTATPAEVTAWGCTWRIDHAYRICRRSGLDYLLIAAPDRTIKTVIEEEC